MPSSGNTIDLVFLAVWMNFPQNIGLDGFFKQHVFRNISFFLFHKVVSHSLLNYKILKQYKYIQNELSTRRGRKPQ
jgi:hypothetical protein